MNQVELLNRITSKIRQSLELQTILDSAVTEVRAFLKTDRVKIYKFDEDGNGQVIAESIDGDRLPVLKGLYFPAGDIPPQARELFLKAKVLTIVDLVKRQIRLRQPDRLLSNVTYELTVEELQRISPHNLLQRPVDPCHVEYLTRMGIKSSLVVPLVSDNRLWGLLIAHHRDAKTFSNSNLQIIRIIGEQLESAISQANLFQQVQQQAEKEVLINQISNLLRSPLENKQILPQVLERITSAVRGSGVLLSLVNETPELELNCYVQGSLPNLSTHDWGQLQNLAPTTDKIRVIPNIYQQAAIEPLLPALKQNRLCSLLLMPLRYKQQTLGNLAVFRQEIAIEKLWAGNSQTEEGQLRPRQSFAEWKELTKGQAQPWTKQDIEIIQSLGDNIGMAIIQDRLYRHERQQYLLVEMRNQELDNARKEAEQASELKSAFLSASSHELRTPLASVLNYLKILKEGFYENEQELAEYLHTAHCCAENLHNIIDSMLDIAKIEAGKMEVDREIVELEPLLQEQYNFFKPETIRHNIDLIIDCQVARVYADRIKLKQVLTNLLNNAFKFTSKGEIRINAIAKTISIEEKSVVEISISDTGIGIEPEKQANIFAAFIQEDSSIRRRYGGTGLGLTICQKLVELMEGQIFLFSEGRDKGTTVTITLPFGLK